MAWASSICVLDQNDNQSSFTLNTAEWHLDCAKSQRSLGLDRTVQLPGYGRMVTRAIRGTSLDVFERW